MARARNIKPGICQNEDLAMLPFEARFLFAVLPCFADRDGRLEDRPLKIKMQVFPADNIDVDPLLQGLNDRGFIQRYQINGIQYIQIVNFTKHQNPHVKELASTIPAPGQHQTNTGPNTTKASTSHADSFNPITDSFNPNLLGDESPDTKPDERTENFERLWAKRPPRAGNDPKHEARKAFNARMDDGEDIAEIENGLERYCLFVEATGKANTEYVMRMSTFLGPSKNYLQDWIPPRALPARSQLENRNEAAIQEALRS